MVEKKETCEWDEMVDWENPYDTECGGKEIKIPFGNGFCPLCGKKIIIKDGG